MGVVIGSLLQRGEWGGIWGGSAGLFDVSTSLREGRCLRSGRWVGARMGWDGNGYLTTYRHKHIRLKEGERLGVDGGESADLGICTLLALVVLEIV